MDVRDIPKAIDMDINISRDGSWRRRGECGVGSKGRDAVGGSYVSGEGRPMSRAEEDEGREWTCHERPNMCLVAVPRMERDFLYPTRRHLCALPQRSRKIQSPGWKHSFFFLPSLLSGYNLIASRIPDRQWHCILSVANIRSSTPWEGTQWLHSPWPVPPNLL